MTRIKIYQVNVERDKVGIAFESLESTLKDQRGKDINASLYDLVFIGEVKASDIEDIYRAFNLKNLQDTKAGLCRYLT